MKIKTKTAYKITFWGFVAITVVCYIWAIYSLVCWVLKAILL